MFSIIIPLYNKAGCFAATVESVLNQTYGDFELIIVNDGSTDNSLEIAESFTDSRIRIFSKKNGGVSAARNYGIERAEMPFIAFLDADDFWELNYLEEMNALIQKYPECGMYASAHQIIYPQKTEAQCESVPEGIVEEYFKTLIDQPVTWTSATVIRKTVFDNLGGFPVGMVAGQDSFTWAKIGARYQVAFTPKVLAAYNLIYSGGNLRAGKADTCKENWIDLYEEGKYFQNEFIAQKAIKAGIRHATGLHKQKSREIERDFSYTRLTKRRWRILYLLNRMPPAGINAYLKLYDSYMNFKFNLKS